MSQGIFTPSFIPVGSAVRWVEPQIIHGVDTQKDRQAGRQADRDRDRQAGRQAQTETETETDRQTGRHGQTDRQAG